MNINDLVIEVTRKCNLKCGHCLRGKAQNKDIFSSTIETFLVESDIKYINTVTFTGGEPTLNIDAINQFINICVCNDIEVGSFYIVINGINVPDEFIITVSKLYAFCTDNEMSQVQVSESDFYVGQNKNEISKLELFKIFSMRKTVDHSNLIREGNAIEWTNECVDGDGRDISIKEYNDEVLTDWNTKDFHTLQGMIYLNVNGDIITCCDLSYDSQDKYKIGNVNNNTLTEMIDRLFDLTFELF